MLSAENGVKFKAMQQALSERFPLPDGQKLNFSRIDPKIIDAYNATAEVAAINDLNVQNWPNLLTLFLLELRDRMTREDFILMCDWMRDFTVAEYAWQTEGESPVDNQVPLPKFEIDPK